MRMTYDRTADAAYVYLVPHVEPGGVARTYCCDPSEAGQVSLDYNSEGQLVGIEILNARKLIPQEVLKGADEID